jgi:hypothetical protein
VHSIDRGYGPRGRRLAGGASAAAFFLLTSCGSPPPSEVAAPRPTTPPITPKPGIALPAPAASRNWAEFKLQAARRMVAADPIGSYTGEVPEPLLAIPVLEVELNADGSVRRVKVLRIPKTSAKDTVDMAIAAVHRAAPFGDVSRLPRPWVFTESFLYDDDRRFKPRSLDE